MAGKERVKTKKGVSVRLVRADTLGGHLGLGMKLGEAKRLAAELRCKELGEIIAELEGGQRQK